MPSRNELDLSIDRRVADKAIAGSPTLLRSILTPDGTRRKEGPPFTLFNTAMAPGLFGADSFTSETETAIQSEYHQRGIYHHEANFPSEDVASSREKLIEVVSKMKGEVRLFGYSAGTFVIETALQELLALGDKMGQFRITAAYLMYPVFAGRVPDKFKMADTEQTMNRRNGTYKPTLDKFAPNFEEIRKRVEVHILASVVDGTVPFAHAQAVAEACGLKTEDIVTLPKDKDFGHDAKAEFVMEGFLRPRLNKTVREKLYTGRRGFLTFGKGL